MTKRENSPSKSPSKKAKTETKHIKEGDKLPLDKLKLYEMGEKEPKTLSGSDIFKGKKVAVVCVPGAFTPVCSTKHVPGYIEKEKVLKEKGLDEIVIITVNDPFVCSAWQKTFDKKAKLRFLGDPDLSFTHATGLSCSLFEGTRLQRSSLLVDDGVVKSVNVESENGDLELSTAEQMLKDLEKTSE